MYHDHRNNHQPIIDVNLFVPGLSVFEDFADGFIQVTKWIAGGVAGLISRIARI